MTDKRDRWRVAKILQENLLLESYDWGDMGLLSENTEVWFGGAWH